MAIDLKIERQGDGERHLRLDRLVNTVGFGDGCDVVLATAGRTERLGMFIQQGEGLSFRPLHQPSGVFMNGMEIESMVEIPSGVILRVLDYDLSWQLETPQESRNISPPRTANAPPPKPLPAYRAGAMMAYGQEDKPQELDERHEGVEVEWSHQVAPKINPTPPTPTTSQPPSHSSNKSLGAAEAELARKLEEARKRMENDMEGLSQSMDRSMGLPSQDGVGAGHPSYSDLLEPTPQDLSPQHTPRGIQPQTPPPEVPPQDLLNPYATSRRAAHEDDLLPMRQSRPVAPEPPPIPKGNSKDVLKHFFNHLDMEVFRRNSTERRMLLSEGLKLAMREVMGEGPESPLYPRMEKELKGAGPLKELVNDEDVHGIMIRDKGNLYIDRGKGFSQPEVSFFNAVHAYWALDRMLLGAGIKMDWSEGQKSFQFDQSWGGRVILPENHWQGSYVVMRRRKDQRVPFSMGKSILTQLAAKVKARENLLIVAPNAAIAKSLSYWFMKQAESLGAILVLSKSSDLTPTGNHPRRIHATVGDEDLSDWVQWSEGMDLAGTLHQDPLGQNGFSLLKTIAHQRHGWWQMIIANDAQAAVEKLELELSLEMPDLRQDLVKKLIQGVFGAVLSIDGKSISGRRNLLKVEDIGIGQRGEWNIPSNSGIIHQGDWGD
jgi:hypothetical protein